LLERLAALAANAGFTRFQATTLSDNWAMMEVFRESGFSIRSKLAGGCIEVVLSLSLLQKPSTPSSAVSGTQRLSPSVRFSSRAPSR